MALKVEENQMNDSIMLDAIAKRLDEAAINAQAVSQLEENIDIPTAYEVQRRSIARRLARGERRIGIKMGLTSKAKMAQVGVSEMGWGRLTDGMLVEDGGTLHRTRYIHPRAEPEIAFRLKAPLRGAVSTLEACAAIDAIAPAIEVIDSRFKNFKFRSSDSIADNTSSAALMIGPWSPANVDISNLGMVMIVNGEPVGIGSSAAILGHPLRSLVSAARLLGRYGDGLEAGDILMSGGATAAYPLTAGMRVQLRVESIGGCDFDVV
jgi:2-oxo-3-hexenedioate decarboxylase